MRLPIAMPKSDTRIAIAMMGVLPCLPVETGTKRPRRQERTAKREADCRAIDIDSKELQNRSPLNRL